MKFSLEAAAVETIGLVMMLTSCANVPPEVEAWPPAVDEAVGQEVRGIQADLITCLETELVEPTADVYPVTEHITVDYGFEGDPATAKSVADRCVASAQDELDTVTVPPDHLRSLISAIAETCPDARGISDKRSLADALQTHQELAVCVNELELKYVG